MKLEYSTEEYIAELQRQSEQAEVPVSGLNEMALNWQPDGGKEWSVAPRSLWVRTRQGLLAEAMPRVRKELASICAPAWPRKRAGSWLHASHASPRPLHRPRLVQ